MAETVECPRCGCTETVFDSEIGEDVCSNCGLVQLKKIHEPLNDLSKNGGQSHEILNDDSKKMKRLMSLDKRLRTDEGDKYVLRIAIAEIERLVQELYLPEIILERAGQVYREAQEKGLITRGTILGFAAASVYAVCRENGLPRSLKSISEISPENLKDISRNYRILLNELGLNVKLDDPRRLVPRLITELNLTMKSERLSLRILDKTDELGYSTGKNPRGLAAAVVYFACKLNGEKCTQAVLAQKAGVSDVTVRKRLSDLKRLIDEKTLTDSDN